MIKLSGVLKEARRNDKVTLACGFWNRASQRRPRTEAQLKRVPSPSARPVTELSGDAGEPGSSATSPAGSLGSLDAECDYAAVLAEEPRRA